eukprot:GGOE01019123.1.p1 GENE.GGOE01019123.1~~GGOE01019123.1.p1  ORF type:complete len:466 (-),score=71.08 GGOE01019123.1:245-1642(-)
MDNPDDLLDAAFSELVLRDGAESLPMSSLVSSAPVTAIEWRWEQTISDLTIYVNLPATLAEARGGDIKLQVEGDTISLEVLECSLLSWFLFTDVAKKDEPFRIQKIPSRSVIILELDKKVPAWWPALLNHQLPFSTEYFLTDDELDKLRAQELQQSPPPQDDPVGEEGVKLEVQVEEETEEDKAQGTDDLHSKAFDLFQGCLKAQDHGAKWNECARLLRILALHRKHGPSRVILQKWVYECDPAAPPSLGNPKRDPRKGFWFLVNAAREGDRPSQTSLGTWYEQGLAPLPSRSTALAIKWYQKAAQAGCCQAMCCLAQLFMQLVPQDGQFASRAVELAKQALERGSADAHKTYSLWYLTGASGWPRDLKRAQERMRAARLIFPEIPDLPYALLEEEKRKERGLNGSGLDPAAGELKSGGVLPTPGNVLAKTAAGGSQFGIHFWEKASTIALGAALVFLVRHLGHK